MSRPPLVLTGGPAAGKSATGLRLAEATPRTAYVDVDDVRQFVKNGGAAPWDGVEGQAQQRLGVLNATSLARHFTDSTINCVIADVLNAHTLQMYREELPSVLIIRLSLNFGEAQRRASLRTVYLSDAEFAMLHEQQAEPLPVDHDLDVTHMSLDQQVETVDALWRPPRPVT